jgi:hypothetical protein
MCTVPSASAIFKCILEVLFCDSAILPRSPQLYQNGGLSVLSSIRETENQGGWAGDNSRVIFGKKFPGEKRIVETVHCDATASSFVAKVWGEVFAHFHSVTVKRQSSMQH